MRRILLILGLTGAVAASLVAMGAGSGGGAYQVRAIFDNAAFVVSGEDVKVAGVKVGKVNSLAVTPDKRAAVVLDIIDPGFQDFRRDATCMIRPQSLIGEQFIECSPTQPRAATDAEPPPLETIRQGPGEGQRLLPVEQTSASVALDLLANINRLPVRQRLTLIINELGTGLAGRGADLNEVIRRSAPALQELNKVLALLAHQNRTLERLAVSSDQALAPLARERRHLTGFITSSATTAAATVERRAALEQDLRKLPGFLTELRLTTRRLGELAGQSTPVASDLRASAADVNELFRQLGPFSSAATPALTSLGAVSVPGIPALKASLPIQRDLRKFAHRTRPVAATLADVLSSFQRTDGIKRLLDAVYHSALSINGYDGISHFLRAALLVNTCSTYTVDPQPECLSKFSGFGESVSPTSASASAATDRVLERTAAVLGGASPKQARAATPDAGARAKAPATTTTAADPVQAGVPKATTGDVMEFLFGKDAQP